MSLLPQKKIERFFSPILFNTTLLNLLPFFFVDHEDVIAIKMGVIEAAGIYIQKVEKNPELISLI